MKGAHHALTLEAHTLCIWLRSIAPTPTAPSYSEFEMGSVEPIHLYAVVLALLQCTMLHLRCVEVILYCTVGAWFCISDAVRVLYPALLVRVGALYALYAAL
jgi:hypothetical protein